MRLMRWSSAAAAGLLIVLTGGASAQISLAATVDLALRNSPKVKMAQADLDKARAALAEAHGAFVPAITATGGYGVSTGVPLGLPVVFSASAQSLVFNFSQKDYVRAAGAGVSAATYALEEARSQVAEDAVTTYVSLDNALQRRAVLLQSASFAARLVSITQDRFDTGLEPHIELTRSQRTSAQLRLQQLLLEDEIATLSDHLTRLTGVTGPQTETVSSSIPAFQPPSASAGSTPDQRIDNPGINAAFANVTAKNFVARGDSRYRLRPQVGFSAAYSRISTVGTNYILYYPGFDPARHPDLSLNSLDFGVQISLPILDLVHQAKARGSAADARHAQFEAETQRIQFLEGRHKLQHAAVELSARAQLASLDRDLAQDQLQAVEAQLQAPAAAAAGPQLTPKDAQNAHLQERQRFLDMLTAGLQLRQAEVTLMRQSGQLGAWLHSTVAAQPVDPAPGTSALPAAPSSVPVSQP